MGEGENAGHHCFLPFQRQISSCNSPKQPHIFESKEKKTSENNVGEGENAGYSNVFYSFKFLHLSLCTIVVSKWFKFGEI